MRDWGDAANDPPQRAGAAVAALPRDQRRGLGLRLSPLSSLTRRIVFINLIGLGLLVAGVLYLNQFRAGLIELRATALRTQSEIIARAVAEAAGVRGDELGYDPVRANFVLRRLAQPAGVRARIFDRSGRLTGDTRSFAADVAPVEVLPLPAPGESLSRSLADTLDEAYAAALAATGQAPTRYRETASFGVTTELEMFQALQGETISVVRANSEGELIVSVALPLQRFKAVMGALVVSSEGGDIDAIVRAERTAILRVFLVALAVSVVLSVLLANGIARPLRRLAEAARRSGAPGLRPADPARVRIPDLTGRGDEIGYLSGALRDMTQALYGRIESIERFAADVAHEIKNPLTSLRSAVETLRRADAPAARARLLAVIEHDVRRLDRLVSDISNASRLDAEMVREDMGEVDLAALLQAVAEVADHRRARVRVRIDPAARAPGALRCRGLDGRLGQVFRNLVDNALSFSPEGGEVRVAAWRAGGRVIVTVDDDGPGLPAENTERIFERFYSDRPGHEAFGDHSGLGLSISRQIVAAHDGVIHAANRPGPDADGPPAGARFTVELPAA